MATKSKCDLEDIVRTAHEWRVLIDGPDATEFDHWAFKVWLAADPRHEEMYGRAETLWSALGEVPATDFDSRLRAPSIAERWTHLTGAIAASFARPSIRFATSGAAFAALALGVFAVTTRSHPETVTIAETIVNESYATELGETRSIKLTDGTSVTLGAASEITTAFSGTTRQAELISGVAFFDIANDPNRPFLVDAADMTVTVTGTAFDVRRTGDAVRVLVAEGDVEVSYPFIIDDKATSLISRRDITAGQQVAASRDDGMQSVRSISLTTVGAWRDDRLIYDGDPLADLVADANRYSARRVVIEGDVEQISRLRIRGAFSGRDIDGMLSTLALIHPVDIDRSEPDTIRIRAASVQVD